MYVCMRRWAWEAAAVRDAQVQAKEVCHPGVGIVMGKARLQVTTTTNRPFVRLYDRPDIQVVKG